jgi:unsaturated rhamnogalacturonyl hydrolase
MTTRAEQAWSVRMADSVIQQHPSLSESWTYEWGLVLKAILEVWLHTGNAVYFDYVKRNVDRFIAPDGGIRTYRLEEYNLDHINPGKVLFPLYHATGDDRYRQATFLLREQLRTHPRTSEGGFWHKQIYPHQMWLDGIYMASPFYAEFARAFHEPAIFDDVARQIALIDAHTCDPETCLHYHGWDESKQQRWADPETGCSPHFWGRGMGWFAMALPDVLDHLPESHPERGTIITTFRRLVSAVVAVQDQDGGVWHQVLDQGNVPGNYLEASASCMFVYALAKGFRQGNLGAEYLDALKKGYEGILTRFVEVDDHGRVSLDGICRVAGLGGTPYRDGSFTYYVSETVVANDYKGIGPFILASVEVERLASSL